MKKTALITGASSGIGAATARALAELGYNLVITGRRTNRLKSLNDELEEKYHVKVHVLGFDIQDRFQTQSALSGLPGPFRRIDLLINNAGLAAGLEHIDEGDWRDWESMIDTNIKGLLCVSRIVSQWMIDQHIKGHIINMGSIAGTQAYENGAVYCATKHAVHALSQGMRMDLLKHGIKVTEIRPGMVETEFSIVRFHGDGFESGRGEEFLLRQARNPLIVFEASALPPPLFIGFDDSDHLVTVRETAQCRHLFRSVVVSDSDLPDFDLLHERFFPLF